MFGGFIILRVFQLNECLSPHVFLDVPRHQVTVGIQHIDGTSYVRDDEIVVTSGAAEFSGRAADAMNHDMMSMFALLEQTRNITQNAGSPSSIDIIVARQGVSYGHDVPGTQVIIDGVGCRRTLRACEKLVVGE